MKKLTIVFLLMGILLSASNGFALIKQLTFFGTPAEETWQPPSLTADGKFLYFISARDLTGNNPNLYQQIFRVDISTGTITQVSFFSDGAYTGQLQVSGNGSRLVFIRQPNNWSTYVMNSDGTGLLQVSHTARWCTRTPSITFDGSRVAYIANESDISPATDIYVVNADATGRQRVYSGGEVGYLLSGDGSKIIMETASYPLHRYLMNSDDSGFAEILYDEQGAKYGLTLSFDGTHSLFVSTHDYGENSAHTQNLFIMRNDGSEIVQITHAPDYPCEDSLYCVPSSNLLSADGQKAVYAQSWRLNSQGGSTTTLVKRNVDGTNAMNLLDLPQTDDGGGLYAINQDASVVIFASQDDYTGQNPNHNREFFAYIDDLTNGLVAYWSFDNCDATDDSGNGNNGMPYGPQCVDGKQGKAFSFDGVDDYIEVPNDPSLNPSAVTVSAWVKVNDFPSSGSWCNNQWQILVFKKNSLNANFEGYTISIGNGIDNIKGTVGAVTSSASGQQVGACSTEQLQLNRWYHVAATITAEEVKIYVNGSLEDTQLTGFPLDHGDRPLFFGHTGEWCEGYFNGLLDDVRIYNRALTEAEIQALYGGESLISANCEQENIFDYGDNCSWPFSQTETRCCCWCPDPTGAHSYGHVMDLGQIVSNSDVYFEFRPGAGDANCWTTGYMYYSLDGNAWTLFWTEPNLQGWTTYNRTIHIQDSFRYIRANTDNCSVDWSTIKVQSAAIPNLEVSPSSSSHDFGRVGVGLCSETPQQFTLSNTGNVDLQVSDITLSDNTNFILDLDLVATCAVSNPTIGPGQSCTIVVHFCPSVGGSINANLTITSNDTDTPSLNVALTGEGVANPQPNISVEPSSSYFGEIDVSEGCLQQPITISNTGYANLIVSEIALSNADDFKLSSNASECKTSINPGKSCAFTVWFCPSSESIRTTTLAITSNDPDASYIDMQLSGRGLTPTDYITKLYEAKDSTVFTNCNEDVLSDEKIPLILIHGIHGTKDSNDNKKMDNHEEGDAASYWSSFANNFCSNSELKNKYKIYLFSYLSDIYSVWEIARSLRNNLDDFIRQGKIEDTQFVILAHSMGGLVARSYMQQHSHTFGDFNDDRGGERVIKLITLATPHHGSPGANHTSRTKLAFNADNRDKTYLPFWMNIIIINDEPDPNPDNNWTFVWGKFSLLYWHLLYGLSWDEPNRKDLLWDNFDNVMNKKANDINVWLKNLNVDITYDNKIIAYYGYFGTNTTDYINLVNQIYRYSPNAGPEVLVGKAAFAKAQLELGMITEDEFQHEMLLYLSILLNYGLYKNGEEPYKLNDGMVPFQSGRFGDHKLSKRVSCQNHDHLDMLFKTEGSKLCGNSDTLFDRVKDVLLNIN